MTKPFNPANPLPALEGWEQSAPGLHQAAALLGAIRMLVQEPVPNYLELALKPEPEGLSTDALPSGGSVLLNLAQSEVWVLSPKGEKSTVPLQGHTQAGLLEAILTTLDFQGQGLTQQLEGSFSKGFLAALRAKMHKLGGSLALSSTQPLHIDPRLSAEYAQALYRVFSATARWKARLIGPQTPLVVWPEHFDLSTLWFATDQAEENAPHMNFGFAPFDSAHPRPYLYAYAYPMPQGFEQWPLPAPARWHTAPWKGVWVPYDELARSADPEALIEAIFGEVYRVLSPGLRHQTLRNP